MKAQIITDDLRQAREMIALSLAPRAQAMRAAIILRGRVSSSTAPFEAARARAGIAAVRFDTSGLRAEAGVGPGIARSRVGRRFAISEDAGSP